MKYKFKVGQKVKFDYDNGKYIACEKCGHEDYVSNHKKVTGVIEKRYYAVVIDGFAMDIKDYQIEEDGVTTHIPYGGDIRLVEAKPCYDIKYKGQRIIQTEKSL